MFSRRLLIRILPIFILSLFFIGCGQTTEEEPVVKVDSSEQEITYRMDQVTVGDVVLTQNINCDYVETNAQEVSFPTGGKIVDKVYVKEGDEVKPGDLLVALQSENTEDEIAELEYNIKRSELQYGYLETYENFDLESAYFDFAYNTDKEEEALKEYEKAQEEIKERYREQREDFEDSLYFDRQKLAEKKAEFASDRVFATMSGTVANIKKDLEGSTAKRDDVIMKVVDNSTGLFETADATIVEFIREDSILPMSIVYGSAKGEYELAPYNMSAWGEKQLFQVVTEPENAVMEVGVSGTITATVELRENVLRIPKEALYEADGKYYTYTLNDDNMRQVCYVEIGLVGDKYVEIKSGVSESEKVIKK